MNQLRVEIFAALATERLGRMRGGNAAGRPSQSSGKRVRDAMKKEFFRGAFEWSAAFHINKARVPQL